MRGMGNIPTFYEEFAVNGLHFDIAKFGKPQKPKAASVTHAAGHSAGAAGANPGTHASSAVAPSAAAPGVPALSPQAIQTIRAAMAQLNPQQQQSLQQGAAKSGITVEQYYHLLLEKQKAAKGKKPAA